MATANGFAVQTLQNSARGLEVNISEVRRVQERKRGEVELIEKDVQGWQASLTEIRSAIERLS